MGNKQTKLDIDPYFQGSLERDTTPVEIRINLTKPVIYDDGSSINQIIIRVDESLRIFDNNHYVEDPSAKKYNWSPRTHMRDFEVIDPYSNSEIKIARGQGIGVIIIETLGKYCKLMYDKKKGVIPAAFTIWNHSQDARDVLSSDLGLGYDVLFIRKDKVFNLCEELDESDQKKTMILFQDLEQYAQYDD